MVGRGQSGVLLLRHVEGRGRKCRGLSVVMDKVENGLHSSMRTLRSSDSGAVKGCSSKGAASFAVRPNG